MKQFKRNIFRKGTAVIIAALLTLGQSVYAEGAEQVLPEETQAQTEAVQADAALETEAEIKINYVPMQIAETYNYEYDLYEEVMNNRFVFYSTVSNGGITDKSVSVELPKNVTCKMEKDGEEVPFANRMTIDEIGSYALNLFVDSKDVYGAEENTVYFGLFRFKITEPKVTEKVTEAVVPEEGAPTASEDKDGEFVVPEITTTTTAVTSAPLITTEPVTEITSGTTVPPQTSSAAATTTKPPKTEENPDKPKGSRDLIVETVSEISGFDVKTRNGAEFNSNIPCGMVTTEKVTLKFSTNTVTKVYKDEKEIDSAQTYSEAGKYEVYIFDGSSEPLPLYTFEIVPTLTNKLDSYEVPSGCLIVFAALDGKQIASAVESVKTEKDGKYSFIVTKGAYTSTVEITKDATPPEISVYGVNEKNIATEERVEIEIVTGDMKSYNVTKNGESYVARSLSFTEDGKYVVEIFDEAGNKAEAQFEIPYKMNAMGVIIVILLVGLVGGVIGYAVYSRRHFKIK